MPENQSPKIFISYSHSTPAHKEWVKNLAEELSENGVNVILDRWDLKPGHDVAAFMEQMVNDKSVEKVILICDAVYTEKANARGGGVGMETQIISPKIYKNIKQEKFIPVLSEKDKSGEPFMPDYCRSLMYIDLSDEDEYAENLKQLLRIIHGEPALVKPDIGEKPDFSNDNTASLGASSLHRKVLDSVRHNKNDAVGLLQEYFAAFAEGMEKIRIKDRSKDFSPTVENIGQFLPRSKEAVKAFSCIARYASRQEDAVSEVRRLFEQLLPYYESGEGVRRETDFDNFKFITHELFLCAIAEFLKHEKFECAARLIDEPYYVPSNIRNDPMLSFTYIWEPVKSLCHRTNVLNTKRLSLHADMLKERSSSIGVKFKNMMQADFVLYIKATQLSMQTNGKLWGWWPETLIYNFECYHPFEIFARAQSMRHFDKIKCLWNVGSPDELLEILISDKHPPKWGWDYLNTPRLANADKLGKSP